MSMTVRHDPAHPRGGHALLILPAGQGPNGPAKIGIQNLYTQEHLGASGWQTPATELGPFEPRRDGDHVAYSLGPEIVDQIDEFSRVRITLGRLREELFWPGDIPRSPGLAEPGGLEISGPRQGLKVPSRSEAPDGAARVEEARSMADPPPVAPPEAPRRSPLPLIAGLLAVAVLASGAWYFASSREAADTTAPTVAINQSATQADPTGDGAIVFDVVFSEEVTGFQTGDVTLSGTAGATTATVNGSGAAYTVTVSGMTGPGTVIASIAAGVATDAAGNANLASGSTDNTVTYAPDDTTAPTVMTNRAATEAGPPEAAGFVPSGIEAAPPEAAEVTAPANVDEARDRLGATASQFTLLQQFALRALGFYNGRADGIAGRNSRTETAISDFQESIGDNPTGSLDLEQFVELIRQAADAGDGESQNTFGMMHAKGVGVPKDNEVAKRWLEAAVSNGSTVAEENLAIISMQTKALGD